jgi:hypothetical protein
MFIHPQAQDQRSLTASSSRKTAQKPASSNMAAQALCEPGATEATTLIGNFKSGFLSAISKHKISGICAIYYLAPIDIFSHGIFGILILIIHH